ncbi:MAG: phosphatidylserine decarboxylase [Acidobacteriota bacterium]
MLSYGFTYALGCLAGAAAVTYLVGWPWAIPFYILAVFCLNFFRDPDRQTPSGPVAVSPADGKVVAVKQDDAGGSRISIFLNIFDVHVNRTPIPGKITKIEYKKGDFLNAANPNASSANEQNILTVEGSVGGRSTKVVFSQIAGLIARRIICYKRTGDVLTAGERIGLIKFGSRVDIFLGPEWQVTATVGSRVTAGLSVIAQIAGTKDVTA